MSVVQEFFNITESDIQNVRMKFSKTEHEIKEDLKTLNEWMTKKYHLPRIQDDCRLERIFLRNKFRIEQTKVKIENYFTMHGTNGMFFDEMRNNFEGLIKAGRQFKISVSPQLNENYERVIYCQVFSRDKAPNWRTMFRCAFLMLELQLMYDYGIGERYIMDGSNLTMNHYKSMCTEINLLLKGLTIQQEGYSGRIMGLEYINAPSYADMFLNVIKKIRIHNSLEDLYKVVDPKYLPSDIGGELREAEFYHGELEKAVRSEKSAILNNIRQVSNEALRLRFTQDKDHARALFGVDGTFKQLNID